MFVTDIAPKGPPVNGHFNKLKKLSHTLVGRHATVACNSNAAAAAAIESWLSSKTIRAHVAKELLRMMADRPKRLFVSKIP